MFTTGFQSCAFQGVFGGGNPTPDTHDVHGGLPKHVVDFYKRQSKAKKKRDNQPEIPTPIPEESSITQVEVFSTAKPEKIEVIARAKLPEIFFDKEVALAAFQESQDDELLILLASIV